MDGSRGVSMGSATPSVHRSLIGLQRQLRHAKPEFINGLDYEDVCVRSVSVSELDVFACFGCAEDHNGNLFQAVVLDEPLKNFLTCQPRHVQVKEDEIRRLLVDRIKKKKPPALLLDLNELDRGPWQPPFQDPWNGSGHHDALYWKRGRNRGPVHCLESAQHTYAGKYSARGAAGTITPCGCFSVMENP